MERLKSHIERLRGMQRKALRSFHAYEEMLDYVSRISQGSAEAKKRALLLSRYKGFVVTVQDALASQVIIELAKLYDFGDQALHINRLIRFAEANQKKLTKELVAEATKGGENSVALSQIYQGFTEVEWLDLKTKLTDSADKIDALKTYRDKKVAHEDVSQPGEIDLTYKDLRDLVDLAEFMLNQISTKFYGNIAYNDVYKDQVIKDTKKALDKLISD